MDFKRLNIRPCKLKKFRSDSLNKNKCFLCEKIISNNNNKTQLITKNQSLDNLNQNLKIYDPNFYFNQTEIENLLYLNSNSGNELISPCSCERRFHKNCILLYALYSNSIRCESCLDLYSICCPEKYSFCSLFLSENYFFSYLLYFILIFLTTIAILIIASSKTLVPEIYSEMKIFFILILILLNIAIIIALVLECFNMKRSKPPISIYIEDKSTQMQNENEGSNPNKAAINHSENQNSNQNLITNNLNNAALSNLNKINKKLFQNNNNNSNNNKLNKSNGGVSQTSHLEYSKNFIEYNEFCLNILRIEIFESKLNFINRNKLIFQKHLEHLNTIRELNDDEFQQQILIKCMDFNSSESDIDVNSIQERKKKFMQQLRSNNNLNSNYNNNNSNSIHNKNSSSKLGVFAKAKKSEKKMMLRKNSFEELEELDEQENKRYNRNFYKNFNEHESENEYAYCKNTNGIIPDVLRNNNDKVYKKHKTYDRQNSETNNPNTENFNTNINSVSGCVRNLVSNKELNLSNIKQENQMDIKSNSINNSGNLINNSPNDLNNNSGEKLILKENNFSGISLIKKTSNTGLNRYNTLSKFSRNHSNNEVNNFDSHGSNKFGKLENEVVDYRDFIVTEEKEIGSNHKPVQPKPRQSAKNRLVRRDSKIPSALFGDLRELKHKNIISGLNQSIHNNSPINDTDGNHSPKNSQNKIPAKKVIRRYSSFNPQIMNNLQSAAGQNQISNHKKAFGSSNIASLGINIFSNNVINTYSLENNFKQQGRINTGEGYDFGKNIRRGTNESNRKLSSNKFIESDSILKAMNHDANKEELQMNLGNQANTKHYSPNIDNIKNHNNKEILKEKTKRNSIDIDSGLNNPINSNCNYEKYYNNNTTNAKDLNIFRDNKRLSLSPGKFQKKPYKESGLKTSFNSDLANAENEVLTQKLNKLLSNRISNSHVGFNINLLNKLVIENSRRNSMESFEKSSGPLKESGSPRNNSKNASLFAANYIAMNPKKIITEDNSLRRASYLMENHLVTIKEDIETPQAPKGQALNEILEINSEFNDEFVYEKNKILSSEESASNVAYANYYNKSNNFPTSNNVDKSLNKNNFGESYDYNDLNNNNNNNNFNNDIKSANNRVGVSAFSQSTSNNFKHITNHLMENIEEIIREDKSETFSEDSEASFKSNSTGNNLKTEKKRQQVSKENEDAKNLKILELEKKESLKSRKRIKSVKNSNTADQENVVRKINSIVSAKKRTDEFFLEDFDKSENKDLKVFKKANSCYDDSNNIKSLKILNNNNSNNNDDIKPFANIKPTNLNSKTIDSYEEKEIKFSNKEQKGVTIGTSNRSNVYIANNNLDSLVISESNEEFKSLESRKNQKNLDSISNQNVVNGTEPLNSNNDINFKNNCEKIKDEFNQVDHFDMIDNSVDKKVNKDLYNKSKEVKNMNEVESKHVKTDELDIEYLIDNNNSSEDESDSDS